VELIQNGERSSRVLTRINNENDELKHRTRETNRQIKHLSTDYCNLISKSYRIFMCDRSINLYSQGITMELVETLQQAVVGRTISNEYIDNVCARLGLARLQESTSNVPDSARSG
jgi:hypothetical protein